MVQEKLTMFVNTELGGFPFISEAQVLQGKLVVACVTSIPESGDLALMRSNAPWLLPAIAETGRHLLRYGFSSAHSTIGRVNTMAHRIQAYIHPHLSSIDLGTAAVAMTWHHKGTGKRDWFFHLVFGIAPEYSQTPLVVSYFNSLDKNCAHPNPSCLVLSPSPQTITHPEGPVLRSVR